MIPICIPNVLSLFWSGVVASGVLCTMVAIFPNSVCIHVSVTIPVALPVVIIVPEKSILCLSSKLTFHEMISAFLFTAMLSPVRIDSSAASPKLSMILISAQTLSQDSSRTISPGTSSTAGMICCVQSLITFAVGELNLLSISIDFSALYSWKNPSNAFNRTIAAMTQASVYSPTMKLSAVAQINTMTIGSVNWEMKSLNTVNCFSFFSLFFPYFFSF